MLKILGLISNKEEYQKISGIQTEKYRRNKKLFN